jgi:hypothetical protein
MHQASSDARVKDGHVDVPGGKLGVGDSIRLSKDVGGAPAGAIGRVLGFLRRDPELLVILLAGGRLLRVQPDDVTKDADVAGRLELDPPASQ